jgi:hypothetical protein
MSPRQKDVLRKELSQRLVEINVKWLKVGHVDEVISLIPKQQAGKCPFDILYASPGKATELMKLESKNKQRPLEYRYGFGKPVSKFDAYECFETKHSHPGCKDLFGANKAYEKIIQKQITKVRNALDDQGCTNIKYQAMPVIFSPSGKVESYGSKNDKTITIDTNPRNNALMGRTLILPKQNLDNFHKYTQSLIETYNLKTHFVDGTYVHRFNGGVHSALNTRHACSPHQ